MSAKVRALLPAVQVPISSDSAGVVYTKADLVVNHILIVQEGLVRDRLVGPPAVDSLVLPDRTGGCGPGRDLR